MMKERFYAKCEIANEDWKTQSAIGYPNIPKGAEVEMIDKDFRNLYGIWCEVKWDGHYYYTSKKNIATVIEEDEQIYSDGEAVIYQNGDRFEIGIVKRYCGGGDYFVNYHTGDTASRTNERHLKKISNLHAFHVIRLDPDDKERRESKKI